MEAIAATAVLSLVFLDFIVVDKFRYALVIVLTLAVFTLTQFGAARTAGLLREKPMLRWMAVIAIAAFGATIEAAVVFVIYRVWFWPAPLIVFTSVILLLVIVELVFYFSATEEEPNA